jgi:hypothetical protein
MFNLLIFFMTELNKLILQMVSAAIQGKRMVVRRRGNKIFLAKAPSIDKNRVPTLNQQEHLNRFSAATAYARTTMANPELEQLYRKKATAERSNYICAVRDYMRAPKVNRIDTAAYNGSPGSTILVKAIDDFCVKEVRVSIFNAESDLVEEGNALVDPINRFRWIYTATQEMGLLSGCKIRATAEDLPGNKTKLEITL